MTKKRREPPGGEGSAQRELFADEEGNGLEVVTETLHSGDKAADEVQGGCQKKRKSAVPQKQTKLGVRGHNPPDLKRLWGLNGGQNENLSKEATNGLNGSKEGTKEEKGRGREEGGVEESEDPQGDVVEVNASPAAALVKEIVEESAKKMGSGKTSDRFDSPYFCSSAVARERWCYAPRGAPLPATAPAGVGLDAQASLVKEGRKESETTAAKYDENESFFSTLCEVFQSIEDLKNSGAGSKKKSILILGNYFGMLLDRSPQNLIYAVFLALQQIGPPYYGLELGVGEASLIRALAECYGRGEAHIKSEFQKTGDLGLIAQQSRTTVSTLFSPQRLSLRSVFEQFVQIARVIGGGAVNRRRDLIKKLFTAAVANEPKYITRFLDKQLRIGVKVASVLAALAIAFSRPNPLRRFVRGPQHPCLPCDRDEFIVRRLLPVASDPVPKELGERIKNLRADSNSSRKQTSVSSIEGQFDAEACARLELRIKTAYSQCPNMAVLLYQLMTLAAVPSNETSGEKISDGKISDGEVSDRTSIARLMRIAAMCPLTTGVPVAPMLAKPTKSIDEVLRAMVGKILRAEFKYDGERIQIHIKPDGTVALFSRNMEVLNGKYPDVAEIVTEALKQGKLSKPEAEAISGDEPAAGPKDALLAASVEVTPVEVALGQVAVSEEVNDVGEGMTDFILDGEVVAYDHEKHEILPFQVLSTRKRKDVECGNITVKICLFLFDCIRANGRQLTSLSLKERLQILTTHIPQLPGRLLHAQGAVFKAENSISDASVPAQAKEDKKDISETLVDDEEVNLDEGLTEELERLLNESMEAKTEGLMIKCYEGPGSEYLPSQRTVNWLKLKKDYLEGIGDSLDLVPVGAWYGRGKRVNFYGAFLLAVYDGGADDLDDDDNDDDDDGGADPDRESGIGEGGGGGEGLGADAEWKTVCKVATGFTQEHLTRHFQVLSQTVVAKPPHGLFFNDRVKPDVFFRPSEVWELRAADLSLSPVHTAAWGRRVAGRGIALRFPRFVRVRDDKKLRQATNSKLVFGMYNDQYGKQLKSKRAKVVSASKPGGEMGEDDEDGVDQVALDEADDFLF